MPKKLILDYSANTTTHHGNISLKENKMKCIFDNKAKTALHKVKVDDGLIASSDHKKCDYLVHWENNEQTTVFYVELKGCDIRKAISQLKSTIKLTTDKFQKYSNKHCVIVSSRMPQMDSTIARLKKDLKDMGFVLHSKNKKFLHIVK